MCQVGRAHAPSTNNLCLRKQGALITISVHLKPPWNRVAEGKGMPIRIP